MVNYQIAKKRYKSIISRNTLAKQILTQETFFKFYGDDTYNRKCHYCKITEEEIEQLINKGNIYTKRLLTRGRRMEVDRKDPHGPYETDNLVLACYWCNNAKSDEFSYKEFQAIGKEIGKIWKKRFQTPQKTHTSLPKEKNYKLMCDGEKLSHIFFALPYQMYSPQNKEHYFKTLTLLIENIIKKFHDININLLYKDDRQGNKNLKNAKTLKEKFPQNIHFIPSAHLDDIWLRDFMPFVAKDKQNNPYGIKAVYAPGYFDTDKQENRKYAIYSDKAACDLLKNLDINYHFLSCEGIAQWHTDAAWHKGIILDGGNLIHNGKTGFVSARIITENIDETFSEKETDMKAVAEKAQESDVQNMLDVLKKQLRLNQIVILPVEEVDGETEMTGHLDGTMRFLDQKKLLIDEAYYKRYEAYLKPIFQELHIRQITIMQTYDQTNKEGAKGILLNYLRVNDTIFVPEYQGIEQLKQILKKERPDISIVPIPEDGAISHVGGIFNCISWGY